MGPVIVFKNEVIEEMISQWLRVEKDNVYTYLNIILSELGFYDDDYIYVYGCTQDRKLCFKVNEELGYSINMRKNRENNVPVFSYNKDEIATTYECLINEDICDVKVNKISPYSKKGEELEEELNDSREYIDYNIGNNKYMIELRIAKPYYLYQLKNQDKLYDYLSKLVLPVSIFDVYKKILEISLDNDINKYALFDLRILNWEEDEFSLGHYEISDLMNITYGNLDVLMVSKNGKKVYSNQENIWTYDTDKVMIEFATVRSDEFISFNTKVKSKISMEECNEILAHDIVMDAKLEVAKVRKKASDLLKVNK